MTRSLKILILAVGLLPGVANAAIFNEFPVDAGNLPSGALSTGAGPLEAIRGTLNNLEVDLFAIYIANLSAFSATTVNLETAADTDDTILYLFDSNGLGIIGNDDDLTASPPLDLLSTIPLNSVSGGPGIYYLAVATFGVFPLSSGGLIFETNASGTLLVPTGPGAAFAVTAWQNESPDESPLFHYRVDLQGAQAATVQQVVPEPSSLATLSIMLSLVSARFWPGRRRR